MKTPVLYIGVITLMLKRAVFFPKTQESNTLSIVKVNYN